VNIAAINAAKQKMNRLRGFLIRSPLLATTTCATERSRFAAPHARRAKLKVSLNNAQLGG